VATVNLELLFNRQNSRTYNVMTVTIRFFFLTVHIYKKKSQNAEYVCNSGFSADCFTHLANAPATCSGSLDFISKKLVLALNDFI